ncbi:MULTISPECIES: hypothetical protein [unclassified Thioalkalivibrio]|uniref:hypothetical protein n=1 Tax=unclassified Thioalkalivibrio TaxID=2621013 RepID=UPI00035E3940|nr:MULTISPECIES: hypothetical protein [unclassified Thioalkalivibrio]
MSSEEKRGGFLGWLASPYFHRKLGSGVLPEGSGSILSTSKEAVDSLARKTAEADSRALAIENDRERFEWRVREEGLTDEDLATMYGRIIIGFWMNVVWSALIAAFTLYVAKNGVPVIHPIFSIASGLQIVTVIGLLLILTSTALMASRYSWQALQIRERSLVPFLDWYTNPKDWIPSLTLARAKAKSERNVERPMERGE